MATLTVWVNAALCYYGSFTWIRIPNLMATLYRTATVHIAQIRTRISTPYFGRGQESESESVSGNVNEPLSVLGTVHA